MSRKKILLLSDDCRMHSGVGRMSRELIIQSLHQYDWVQIGGAVKHPEEGSRVEVKSDEGFKIPDGASCVIYPVSGYGNPDLVRQVISNEKPDAILHFTDPRQWIWLYNMEDEIRASIPIMYLNIWDDVPTPWYNRDYYRSCDLLLAISKQTYGINKRILTPYDYKDWQVKYLPHGINRDFIHPVDKTSLAFKKFEQQTTLSNYSFKVLYLNRNIRRKMPGDFAMAYKHFVDGLPEEQRKSCCLVFHSVASDDNGTDMKAIFRDLLPDENIIFTYETVGGRHFTDLELNYLYNSVDVYMNIASNEGFGLGSCEALHTGTPIVVNVTGGLQDQCGFKNEKGEYLTAEDYVELESNHRGKYKDHGEWVKPVFPSNISLQGSPLTPYIFDDRCQYEDAGDALRYWYDKTPEEREEAGKKGMEFVTSEQSGMDAVDMGKKLIEHLEECFANWKPKSKYVMEVV